jgi:DNA-binding LacI/PurR family transcriptional regulator
MGQMGYQVEPFKIDRFKDGVEATQVLFSRGFQGLILPAHFKMAMLPGMDWNRFSVVAWGEGLADRREFPQPNHRRVTVDHFGVVLRAWEETRKRGYRKIGYALLKHDENFRDDQLRIAAAQFCLREVSPRFRVPLYLGRIGENFDPSSLGQWARHHRPDAVIGFNPVLHWGLQHEGFRIPNDFGFAVLYRDVDFEQLKGDPSCSGMKEMRQKSMMEALELLDQQIRRHQFGISGESRVLLIDSEWVDGETLPKTKSPKKNRET